MPRGPRGATGAGTSTDAHPRHRTSVPPGWAERVIIGHPGPGTFFPGAAGAAERWCWWGLTPWAHAAGGGGGEPAGTLLPDEPGDVTEPTEEASEDPTDEPVPVPEPDDGLGWAVDAEVLCAEILQSRGSAPVD